MKPYLFLTFVVTLIVVTLAVKGCESIVTPAVDTTVRSTSHHIAESLGSIPSFNDWTAKPSPAITADEFLPKSPTAKYGVVAPDRQSVVATYRSPDTDLEEVDEAYLGHVKDHLDIAMYSFTDQALARAVLKLANSGVHVRIYRDQQQYQQESGVGVGQLLSASANIHIKVKGDRDLMHIKGWSDARMLRDGSANWSISGERYQDNTLVLTTDPTSVLGFETDFESMWNRVTNKVVQ